MIYSLVKPLPIYEQCHIFRAFDVFRPPGYQRPVLSGDSRQYLLNEVNQGVRIANNEPLAMENGPQREYS